MERACISHMTSPARRDVKRFLDRLKCRQQWDDNNGFLFSLLVREGESGEKAKSFKPRREPTTLVVPPAPQVAFFDIPPPEIRHQKYLNEIAERALSIPVLRV